MRSQISWLARRVSRKTKPYIGSHDILRRMLIRWVSLRAEQYLVTHGILQTVKITPALIREPEAERVLVLAPHFDDEVIGCGGTIVRHVLKGADVSVAFFTDGRLGSSALMNLEGAERSRFQKELMITRRREATLSLATLGVKEGIYLDAVETMIASDSKLPSKLRNVLDHVRPQIVYLPFFLEEHPDHRTISQVLLDATRGRQYRFDCFGYEVWTPLFPNCLVDISDVADVKKEALLHYASQLADTNYLHTALLGLNAYRSTSLKQRTGYVEAFFMSSLDEYRRLYNAYCLH